MKVVYRRHSKLSSKSPRAKKAQVAKQWRKTIKKMYDPLVIDCKNVVPNKIVVPKNVHWTSLRVSYPYKENTTYWVKCVEDKWQGTAYYNGWSWSRGRTNAKEPVIHLCPTHWAIIEKPEKKKK